MRSVSRFVPRFDSLESHVCLSDLLSNPATSTWLSTPTTTQTTIQTVTVPFLPIDPSQPLSNPTIVLAGVDGTMPTTPGVNLDIYPPAISYGGGSIPQIPVTPQDPSGFAAPAPSIPKLPLDPVPYFPPPYGIPTYVTLSNMSLKPVT